MLIKPWHIIVATVTASVVAVTGVGAVGVDEFRSSQTEAIELAQGSLSDAQERIDEAAARIADLELAISNAQDILDGSQGKTLDEQAREDLDKEIAASQKTLKQEKEQLFSLKQTVRTLAALDINGFFWPGNVKDTATAVSSAEGADTTKIITKVSGIGDRIKAVQSAQATWQAEQDRVAAEKAAAEAAAEAAKRMAAPRKISQTSTLTDDGGATAPSAPAPPANSAAVEPVLGFSVESYVLALAPNSYIEWVDDLCSGYYVCGRAWVGGVNTTPVRIELDGLLREIYSNPIGISVLVHEAAHARQWWNYGADIITTSEQQSGLTGVPAVEYMADCATIGKLGYSTGAYTSSCSPDQLASISGIW
jgi:hypothetical protein